MAGRIVFALYTISTFPIHFLFFIASLLSSRARNFRKIRIQSKKYISNLTESTYRNKPTYWFHGASVGELDQAKALGRELKFHEPDSFLILSWISDSVTEKNLKDSPADLHIPLPLDGPFSYNFYFKKFQPKKLVIFAWDTWTYFIKTAKKNGTQVYLACATLGEASGRMGFFSRNLTRMSFSWLNGILPAHPTHESRIRNFLTLNHSNQITNPHLTDKSEPPSRTILSDEPSKDSNSSSQSSPWIETLGDTRFDSVIQKVESTKPPLSFSEFLKGWNPEIKPILFASTYPICEKAILNWARQSPYPTLIWIFPHKLERKRIQNLVEEFNQMGWLSSTYSNFHPDSQVVVFDELGILAFAYKYGRFAYVGGGFHHRIHNTIEPAYWSLPLLTGPRIFNSSEAQVMEELGGLKKLADPESFTNILLEWNSPSHSPSENQNLVAMGETNRKFVMENKGASQRIYQKIWKENF